MLCQGPPERLSEHQRGDWDVEEAILGGESVISVAQLTNLISVVSTWLTMGIWERVPYRNMSLRRYRDVTLICG